LDHQKTKSWNWTSKRTVTNRDLAHWGAGIPGWTGRGATKLGHITWHFWGQKDHGIFLTHETMSKLRNPMKSHWSVQFTWWNMVKSCDNVNATFFQTYLKDSRTLSPWYCKSPVPRRQSRGRGNWREPWSKRPSLTRRVTSVEINSCCQMRYQHGGDPVVHIKIAGIYGCE